MDGHRMWGTGNGAPLISLHLATGSFLAVLVLLYLRGQEIIDY